MTDCHVPDGSRHASPNGRGTHAPDVVRSITSSGCPITEDVLWRTMGLAPSAVTAEVRDGRVELGGSVEFRSLIPVIERLCGSVDGVVSVTGHIDYRNDDAGSSSAGG